MLNKDNRVRLGRTSSSYLFVSIDFINAFVVGMLMVVLVAHISAEELTISAYLGPLLMMATACVVCSAVFGLYDQDMMFSTSLISRSACAWFIVISTLSLVAVLTKSNYTYSRAWLLLSCVTSCSIGLLYRIYINRLIERCIEEETSNQDLIVIGDAENIIHTTKRLLKNERYSYHSIIHVPWTDEKVEDQIANLEQRFKRLNVAKVWAIGGDSFHQSAVNSLLDYFSSSMITVSYFPDFSELNVTNFRIDSASGLACLVQKITPLSVVDQWLKSLFDRVFAFIILLTLSPLLLILAVGVKLSSSGPCLYRQERLTINGQCFEMLKFRSMPIDIEDKSGPVWARRGESRATKFGQFLRRTSLDELPQFFNVLKGEMSIVGPRPERPFFVKKFKENIPCYMQKHYVCAGITGLAQVNGFRGNTSIQRRIEYDLSYIQNWSLGLDIKIIFLTIFKGFISKSAY